MPSEKGEKSKSTLGGFLRKRLDTMGGYGDLPLILKKFKIINTTRSLF